MEASDSFYEFDTVKSTFSDRNQVSAQANIFQSNNREDSLKFGDLGLYNEESIDLEQYLHLGNTPPNINGDELLKQFGAYSSSPPVTVSIKPQTINASGISQGLAAFSLAGSNPQPQEPSVVQTTLSSSATTTQLGFQIKQEIEEHSVPEFYQDSEMPPGEEQPFQMAQGEQSNLGGQQVYITLKSLAPGQNVTTTSTADEPYNQAYNSSPEQGGQDSSDSGSVGKKRHRSSVNKESEEYKTKRFRNNLAVRKSREKSKARNKDLQSKVQSLQGENDKLNKKVELLTKELTVLRSLFTTVKPNNTSQ